MNPPENPPNGQAAPENIPLDESHLIFQFTYTGNQADRSGRSQTDASPAGAQPAPSR